MSKLIKETLINALAPGDFISGQEFAKKLHVSRTAISKNIIALEEVGFEIYKVSGKGYRLAKPLSLLNENVIQNNLLNDINKLHIDVHNFIDSTNSYLLRQLPNKIQQGQVCLAEYQQSGRGRRGRQWVSPFGANLYMSMYWRLDQGLSAAMGLSVISALAIADAIKQELQLDVQLKWPNDIYYQGKKLAGILIDLEGQPLELCHSVIGIGLNIDMPKALEQKIDQPYTDLQSHYNSQLDRNSLAAAIINCLYQRLSEHPLKDASVLIEQWRCLDYFYNKPVKLISGDKTTLGRCKGINHQGALLLEVAGEIKTVFGGEVSLRGQDEATY